MEKNRKNSERRPYVKPEAELWLLRLQENIATSEPEETVYYPDEFDGEDDVIFY